MKLSDERPRFFQRAIVRGVALGCAIQLAGAALSAAFVLFTMNLNVYSSAARQSEAGWIVLGGSLLSTAVLIGVALHLRRLHELDRARGVALSIPLALPLGLAIAAGLFLLLVSMCRGFPS